MRAVVLRQFGPPQRLVPADVPEPVVGGGQALIDVEFANITFVETQVRAGRPPNPAMAPALPVVPGNGVGGVVSEVGVDVDASLVGRRVISATGGSGAYAERVVVDADGVIEVPDDLAMVDAVALLADGRTAMRLIRGAAVHRGETVLVEAAAGGVGSLLVQLAHNAGARVVAAAGGARKLELARELGAEFAVDYKLAGWDEEVREHAGGVDVVFDGVGGEIGQAAFALLRSGGRFSAFGMASGAFADVTEEHAAEHGVTLAAGGPLSPREARALTREALAEATAGRLRPVVGQSFPLERASDAHAAIESRSTIGKTLLAVRAQAEPAPRR